MECNNIKVDRFKNLEAYVQVELLPYSLFNEQNKKISKVSKKTERLVLNESIEL